MPIFIFIALYIFADLMALLMVGHMVGVLATLLLVLVSGFIGIQLIKHEGMQALRRVQIGMLQGQVNKGELLRGSTSVISGFLLLMPGPISDLLGIIALIPLLLRRMNSSSEVEPYHPDLDPKARTFDAKNDDAYNDDQKENQQGQTLEGEYIEHDPHGDKRQ